MQGLSASRFAQFTQSLRRALVATRHSCEQHAEACEKAHAGGCARCRAAVDAASRHAAAALCAIHEFRPASGHAETPLEVVGHAVLVSICALCAVLDSVAVAVVVEPVLLAVAVYVVALAGGFGIRELLLGVDAVAVIVRVLVVGEAVFVRVAECKDGLPKYKDADDDGDGIDTKQEIADAKAAGKSDDVDGDGKKNWLDDDSDGDGIKDGAERTDADKNGVADYLEKPGMGLGVAPDAGTVQSAQNGGGVAGGGINCSAAAVSELGTGTSLGLIAGLGVLLTAAAARRSKRTKRAA